MGRNAGDIALWAGIATGADEIIIPEEDFKIEDIVASIRAGYECGKDTISSFWQKVLCQQMNLLKTKRSWRYDRSSCAELGHIQRWFSTARDRVLASRTGAHAVKLLKKVSWCCRRYS